MAERGGLAQAGGQPGQPDGPGFGHGVELFVQPGGCLPHGHEHAAQAGAHRVFGGACVTGEECFEVIGGVALEAEFFVGGLGFSAGDVRGTDAVGVGEVRGVVGEQ